MFEIQSGTGLANVFDGVCSDCLEISSYFFHVSMEMLKIAMDLWQSKFIINFLTNIIISAYYFICNKVLLDECDEEENLQETGANITSCMLRKCHIFAP